MIDRANVRAVLWALLYELLVVLVVGSLIEGGVSPVVAAPIGLFALPLLASVPFLFLLKPKAK
jgi:sorbitol-specific phosphotransferase system component IIBC